MTDRSLLWTQPEWIAEAQEWIRGTVRVTGPIEQPHVRPWATVMRAPTAEGPCFFKASMPLLAFEPALTLALAATDPDCMPDVLAADTARGWMLTRDAGTPLRARLHSAEDLRLLDPVLPRLAQLQMRWADRPDELAAMGVPDCRVERLPARFERLAADREALLTGQPDGLSEAQHERLLATLPHYAALCACLLEHTIPQSIHYDDMHTANIFLPGGENGRFILSDWGDSSVSHPFCSLLIFLRQVADAIDLPEESTQTPEGLPPVLARLRDLYLEPWQAYEPQEELVTAFNLAWRAGMVARALSWDSTIRALDEADRAPYRYTVPAWLGEFLLSLP